MGVIKAPPIAANDRHWPSNGGVSLVWTDDAGNPVAVFDNGAILCPGQLPAHDSAFATTVHKARGSAFDAVALVLPRPTPGRAPASCSAPRLPKRSIWRCCGAARSATGCDRAADMAGYWLAAASAGHMTCKKKCALSPFCRRPAHVAGNMGAIEVAGAACGMTVGAGMEVWKSEKRRQTSSIKPVNSMRQHARWLGLGELMIKGTLPAVICRAAGDKTKGFRFQKIRACIRLLERIAERPNGQIYCAMEFLDDSVLLDSAAPTTVAAEENKLYTSALTFNAKAVRNTVVAFLDLDGVYMYEGALGLAVYASAPLGDEAVSKKVRLRAGVTNNKSKYQILKKLVARTRLTDDEVAISRVLILDEYAEQYSKGSKGHLETLKTWSNAQFRGFLERIEWSVSTETNDSLETVALDLVRSCPFFDYRHENLEAFIFAAMLDLLEKRSQSKSLIEKMVGTSDIRALYLQCAAAREEKPIDPAYKVWEQNEINDKRNISEKVLAVAPTYAKSKLAKLERRVGLAKHESQQFDREYVSVRHRVLDACQEELEGRIKSHVGNIDPDSVDKILSTLADRAMECISNLSGSYFYRIKDQETIKGVVLSLFDDCYLSLESEQKKNG